MPLQFRGALLGEFPITQMVVQPSVKEITDISNTGMHFTLAMWDTAA